MVNEDADFNNRAPLEGIRNYDLQLIAENTSSPTVTVVEDVGGIEGCSLTMVKFGKIVVTA